MYFYTFLKSFNFFNVLNLNFSEVKDTMHLYLAGNNKLLTDKRLEDKDCEVLYKLLQNNVFVTSLDLRYNNITDEGIKFLSKLLEVLFVMLNIYLTYRAFVPERVKIVDFKPLAPYCCGFKSC